MKTPYRYALMKDTNTWYNIAADIIAESKVPVYFSRNFLANWIDTGISDERNMRMGGFTRNYSEDNYQFVGAGASILRQIWYQYGNNAKVTLYVERLNPSTQEYEFDYQSGINFSTATDSRDHFGVKLLEDSIAAKIKAREDVTYEIPFDATNMNNIAINPMKVLGTCSYLTAWPIIEQDTITSSFTAYNAFMIYCIFVNKSIVKVMDTPASEPISNNDASQNHFVTGQRYLEMATGGTYAGSILNNYLFKANTALTNIKAEADIPFFIDNHTDRTMNCKLQLIRFNSGTGLFTIVGESNVVSIAPGNNQNFTFHLDVGGISMNAGERLGLQFLPGYQGTAGSTADGYNVAWEKDWYLRIQFEHNTNQFTVSGTSWYNVGKALINKITDGTATFKSDLLTKQGSYSDYYDLQPAQVYMLTGDSIRGTINPVIKVSLADYLKASFVMLGAGFGIEGDQCVMEKYEYFFNSDDAHNIALLDEVSSVEIDAAGEFNYNQVNIGYREYEYDDLNGKDEPNTTHQYSTTSVNDKLQLDLISPVRADGYGIFYTWVQYSLSENRDSTSDNDLFALQVVPIATPIQGAKLRAAYPADFNSNATVTGMLETVNVMNLGLAPERCIRRLGRYLQSCYFGQDNQVLKYQTTTRNPHLVSTLSTGTITANADIPFNTLGKRIFYPLYINVSVNSPANYRQQWAAIRNGNFKVKYKGRTYTAYPIQTGERNAIPKVINFKLLAADLGK